MVFHGSLHKQIMMFPLASALLLQSQRIDCHYAPGTFDERYMAIIVACVIDGGTHRLSAYCCGCGLQAFEALFCPYAIGYQGNGRLQKDQAKRLVHKRQYLNAKFRTSQPGNLI